MMGLIVYRQRVVSEYRVSHLAATLLPEEAEEPVEDVDVEVEQQGGG